MSTERRKVALVAFGGNALLQPGDRGTQEEQVARARQASRWLAEIVVQGWRLVIVHGNGPQVGNILIQAEEASTKIPPQSLDIAVAQTEGSIGFLLQQAMRNRLEFLQLEPEIATILSEVEVDLRDPAFRVPTKPIGPFFTRYRAEVLTRDFGWTMREDSGRGWRKVVASPKPKRILNTGAVRSLVESCDVVIAGGGGGIPVVLGRDRQWRGVEAVIDKDYASALIATEVDAELFIIITGIARVAVEFGRPTQRWLEYLSVGDAERYLEAGEFPAGSMGPKVEAALGYVRRTGNEVLITDIDHIREALEGGAGTIIGTGETRYVDVPSD